MSIIKDVYRCYKQSNFSSAKPVECSISPYDGVRLFLKKKNDDVDV